MNSKKTLDELTIEALAGNFGKVYTRLLTEKPNFGNNTAIKIVVAVCNVCYKNISTPEKLNHEDLCKLIKCLLGYFHNLNDEDFVYYVQSVFHIIKFLKAKNELTCIIELKRVIIPEFLPLTLTEKHQSVYKSIAKTLYNEINKASGTNLLKNQKSEYAKVSFLIADIYKMLQSKDDMFDSAYNCLFCLITLKLPTEDLFKFYVHIFNLFEPIEDSSTYPTMINTFSLLYTNFLKTEEFQKAKETFQWTTNQINKLLKSKEFPCLSEILSVAGWLNPVNNLEPVEAPKLAHSALKNYLRTYKVTKNLQSVCDLVSSVSRVVSQIYKKSKMWGEKIEVHSIFFNFLYDVSLVIAKTPKKCENCDIKVNIYEAIKILNSLCSFAKIGITNREATRFYKLEIIRYLNKQLEFILTLKEKKCQHWTQFWYDLGSNLYNIGYYLYKKQDSMCLMFFKKFINKFVELETQDYIIDKNFLASSFNLMANSYYETQNFEKCLFFSSLSVLVSDENKTHINLWIKAKASSKEKSTDNLQQETLVSILEKFGSDLCKYLPKEIKLSNARKIELLIYELNQYQAKWRSKAPMYSAFKQLCELSTPTLCSEIFIEIWANSEVLVHDNLPKCLDQIINKLELEQGHKKNLLLAHLYFLKHKYKVRTITSKNSEEMEKTFNTTKLNEAVPPDPDDECDLISSYDCLKLTRHIKITHHLTNSLELATKWVKNNKDYDERLFHLLANLGQEFSLYCHVARSLEAWFLALTVAKALKNALYTVRAISFIVEKSDASKSLTKHLMQEGDSCALNLKDEDLIIYHLCKTESLLYHNFNCALDCFNKCLQISEKGKFSGNTKARICLMHYKFAIMPTKYKINREIHYLERINEAISVINEYYGTSLTLTTYDMRVFFEVYENMVQMCHNMRMPRESRCYAKDAVLKAQKLVLPLRVATFLYHLAYADVRTKRLDDCRVKVNDYSNILGTAKIARTASPVKIRDEVDLLINNMQELLLEAPKVESSGSPVFVKEKFQFPAFLSDDDECTCWYCTCLEYQEHVLRQTFLSGLLSEHLQDFRQAQDFFLGCFKIYEWLLTKSSAEKIFDLIPSPNERFLEIYLVTRLEYGYFMVRNGKVEEAESLNLKNISWIKSEDKYLSRLLYVFAEICHFFLIIGKIKEKEAFRHVAVPPTQSLEKTPEDRKSQLTVPTFHLPQSESRAKILPKVVKFDLDDVKGAAAPPPIRTPATSVSRIKIHVDKRRKRKGKSQVLEFCEDDCDLNTAFVTPEPVDRKLAAKTKLLTEKLKNSKRKVKEDGEGSKEELKDVKQNLMNDLGPDEKTGAVRRSTRNKN